MVDVVDDLAFDLIIGMLNEFLMPQLDFESQYTTAN